MPDKLNLTHNTEAFKVKEQMFRESKNNVEFLDVLKRVKKK